MGDEFPNPEHQVFGYEVSKAKGPEEKCVDSKLWQACAGSMVKIPAVESLVYYFPQGHAEHAQCSLDDNLLNLMNKPPFSHVLCRVNSLKLMADPETDEVFAKIRLVPIKKNPSFGHLFEEETTRNDDSPVGAVTVPFVKRLTHSDINNERRFTVPRQCAETIFPGLDHGKEPPVQYITCTDVHGGMWSFKHAYRGTPKRHLLTTGWSTFVKQKKLVAGDSIVFMKKESNGEIHVGIRRMKGGHDHHRWTPPSSCNSRMSFQDSNNNNMLSKISSRRIRMESVMEAMRQAWSGQTFEVEYYPRAGTPAYCVNASLVRKATVAPWCLGMKIKMAVESDDHPKTWFTGTISGVDQGGEEQTQWEKKLLWRRLEVKWENDASGVLKDVKRVNPWLIERVSALTIPLPASQLTPHPPYKKQCLTQFPSTNQDYLSSAPSLSPLISTTHQLKLPLPQQLPLPYSSTVSGIQGSRRHNDDKSMHNSSPQNFHIGSKLITTSKPNPNFPFKDNEVGKSDITCIETAGVGHRAATATNNSCDDATYRSISTSIPSNDVFILSGKTMVMDEQEEQQNSDVSTSGNDVKYNI